MVVFLIYKTMLKQNSLQLVVYCFSAALEEAAGGHTRSEPKETPLSLGELTVNDLPPVPDISNLSINVDEKECVHMGNVSGIVDQFGNYAS